MRNGDNMKKSMLILFISMLIVVSSCFFIFGNLNRLKNNSLVNQIELNSRNTKDDVYEEIILTKLYPYVRKDLDKFYGQFLKYTPSSPPYVMKIIKVEKPDKLNQYEFLITVRVSPYVQSHITVGEDELTYKLDLWEVNLEKYKHIKDYKLPPHLEHLYK